MAMPARLRLTGSHNSSRVAVIHTMEGSGSEKPPTMRFWNATGVPPPGPLRTSKAAPARMKLAARVTTMSGMPETTMIQPKNVETATLIANTTTAMTRLVPRSWPIMSRAAMQLASTICAPMARLMPPPMTMTPWAIARNARPMVPAVMVRSSNPPNVGSCEWRHRNRAPSRIATAATQP